MLEGILPIWVDLGGQIRPIAGKEPAVLRCKGFLLGHIEQHIGDGHVLDDLIIVVLQQSEGKTGELVFPNLSPFSVTLLHFCFQCLLGSTKLRPMVSNSPSHVIQHTHKRKNADVRAGTHP